MNILIAPMGRDGCSQYRIIQPYKAIQKLKIKDMEIAFLGSKHTGGDMLNLVQGADYIVIRPGQEKLFSFIKDKNIGNAKIILDYDDDMFNISPFSPIYRFSGTEEVEYEGKKLWENGKSGFNIEDNKKALTRMVNIIKKADIITVTTKHLKKVMEKIGAKNVYVLDNAINFDHWKKWDFRKKKEIRIGWTGGSTHYIDWYTIKDPLKRVFDKYKDSDIKLKLVLQGCKWDGTIKGIDYEFYDWIDFEGHPYKTASLNLDIAIIPLKDTKFNQSKSCIKWYEFSSLGIPSVVSNVIPYSEEISKDTAMPYDTPEEFEKQLIKLIENKELRKKIGDNAYKYVKNNKDLKKTIKEYIKIL